MTPSLAEGLALIFDMDGVLVDSNPAHRAAWAAFNRRYGVETTQAMQERMYGRRNDQIVRVFFGDSLSDDEVTRRGNAKEELYREMTKGRVDEMLVPGLRAFLDRFRGAPMAVASNAEPENLVYILDEAELRGYFPVVVDGHQVHRPKPDPEIYLLAASRLGVRPENCIVFEDSESGTQAAVSAHMRVVGVLTTHAALPGTAICVHNFLDGDLDRWLLAQVRAV